MIGVIEIATATVTALAPYLPQLLKGAQIAGEKFGEGLATKAGEVTLGKITEIWGKIKNRFTQHPELEHAAALAGTQPSDTTYQTVFAKALAAYLQQDSQLSEDLLNLLGGEKAVQKVIADRSSMIEDVTQEMEGTGKQSVEASDNSVIRGVRQVHRK
jgi:hypothetical protein